MSDPSFERATRVLLVDDPVFRDLGAGTPSRTLARSVDIRTDTAVGYVRKAPLPERYDALVRWIERALERERGAGPGEPSVARAIDWFCR